IQVSESIKNVHNIACPDSLGQFRKLLLNQLKPQQAGLTARVSHLTSFRRPGLKIASKVISAVKIAF
ncbi:hypothetical protein RMT89_45495, partial [Streptomyces sp. P17]